MKRINQLDDFEQFVEWMVEQECVVAVQPNVHKGNISRRINFISSESLSEAVSIPEVSCKRIRDWERTVPDALSFHAELSILKNLNKDGFRREAFKWLDNACKCGDIKRKASMTVAMNICIAFIIPSKN